MRIALSGPPRRPAAATSSSATTPAPRTRDSSTSRAGPRREPSPRTRRTGPRVRRSPAASRSTRAPAPTPTSPPPPRTCKVDVRARVDFGNDPAKVGAKLTREGRGDELPHDLRQRHADVVDGCCGPGSGGRRERRAQGRRPGVGGDGGQDRHPDLQGQQESVLQRRLRRPAARLQREPPTAPATSPWPRCRRAAVPWTNSLERCSAVLPAAATASSSRSALAGTLELSSLSDPPVRLRVADGQPDPVRRLRSGRQPAEGRARQRLLSQLHGEHRHDRAPARLEARPSPGAAWRRRPAARPVTSDRA